MFELNGRVAVITGGAGVLGSAIGLALAEMGAKVFLGSRDAGRADAAIARGRDAGVTLHPALFDPGDPAAVRQVFDVIERDHGPIQVLVNAAGGNQPDATVLPGSSFADVPPQAISAVMQTNVLAGAVVPTQSLIARVQATPRATSVIMIGSVSSAAALTRVAGYGMAKAAVENLTRWLAVHAARDLQIPLRVNAIVPGFFLTEQNRFLLRTPEGALTARGQTIVRQTPMGRFGEADELGGAAVWLASDASSFVTGAIIDIDGGFLAWSGV